MTKFFAGIIVAMFVIGAGLFLYFNSYVRIDPGDVGVLIDYGAGTASNQPQISTIPTGQWHHIGWTQRLAKYPVSQQTTVMVLTDGGKDDSVRCQDNNGIVMKIDSRALWRVDQSKIAELYLLRPGYTLNSGKEGAADIAWELVRPAVRNAIYEGCSYFTYDKAYADRAAFNAKVEDITRRKLAENHILMDQLFLSRITLEPEQQKAITEKANAQQRALAAESLAQQRENEARGAVAVAEGEKKVKILQAEADAEAIRLKGQALKENPEVIQLSFVEQLDKAEWVVVPSDLSTYVPTPAIAGRSSRPQPTPTR